MQSPTSQNFAPAPPILWLCYALLAMQCVGLASVFIAILSVIVLVMSIITWKKLLSLGNEWGAAHAKWQMNTVLIGWAILFVGTCVLIGVLAWIGISPETDAQLNDIANSNAAPVDMLLQTWNVSGIRPLLLGLAALVLIYGIWPMKRVLQGMFALRAGQTPQQYGGLSALLLSMLLMVAVIAISLYLM